MTLVLDHGQAQINLGPASDAASPTVLLIGFDRRRVTAVKRGENGGRTPAHVDVVHGIEEVARSGGVGEIAAPIPSVATGSRRSYRPPTAEFWASRRASLTL